MRLFSTFVAMEPTAKGRARTTKAGYAFTPTKTLHAEHRVQEQVAKEWPKAVLEGPLAVTITAQLLRPKSAPKRRVTWPIGRPDADNYAKLVLDALNGVLWRDDSQVVDLHVRKVYSEHLGFAIEVDSVEVMALLLKEVG